jgi:putative ABC transport system permease protein
MGSFFHDLRLALRALRKNPGFAAAAVLTLALGIGANSAMFTVIRAVLLKPLAYRNPERVVQLSGGATIAHFEEMKAAQQSYSDIGASFCCPSTTTLSGPEGPVALKEAPVSANFLKILGVEPLVGRGFLPEEDSPDAANAAMISDELWQTRFQGDPKIAGKSATIGAAPYTIVGVLPSGFDFPTQGIDIWVTRPEQYMNSTSPMLQPFARLKAGATLAQASAELAVLNQRYRATNPAMLDAKQPTTPERVVPLKDTLVDNIRSTLWMLAGAVGLVLLIACANVAGLLLARAASRSREFAVRAALGASRSRLIGQLLKESALLAGAGGLLGVLFGYWSLRAILRTPGFDLPRSGEIQLDAIVLTFTAALSIGSGFAFGLIPSLGASRPDLAGMLRASGEAAGPSGRRRFAPGLSARGALVIAQVALSMVLLTGAALLIQTIVRLRAVDPGFETRNILTMRIALPPARYDSDAKQMAFYNDLVRRVEALPGVRSAALAFSAPFSIFGRTPIRAIEQGAIPLNQRPLAMFQNVTPDYFETLGIPLRRGRGFTLQDDAAAPLTAIINEALARELWPGYPNGPDPVGQSIWIGASTAPVEIAGIVGDVRQKLGGEPTPAMYRPLAQFTSAGAFLVRTNADPLRFANAVRAQVQAIDRDQAVSAVESLEDLEDAAFGQMRLIVPLLSAFAFIAALLALTGIYGVIAYSVAQRTKEVGIRRALGAQHADILRLVLRQGLMLGIAGIVLGAAGGLALTRFLKSLLFGISPTDPATFAGVAILFLAVAVAASYIPARRATRIDPMQAMR